MGRPIAGGTESTGHGGRKFDGGQGSNKGLKSAFRTRAQDASANGAGHLSPHKPTPGAKAKGGARIPSPQA